MSSKYKIPRIIGYVDLNLNCVYSAIETAEKTLVKHMVISKDPKFFEHALSRVEMSFSGYQIEPVLVTSLNLVDDNYVKAPVDKSPVIYWELGWFKADYLRWLVLGQLEKKSLEKVFGKNKVFKTRPNPTTQHILTTNISQLLAAHISYAYCCDIYSKDEKHTIGELLDIYINHFDLTSKHGNGLHAKVTKIINGFNIKEILAKDQSPDFVMGVDTFYNLN